MAFKCNFMYQCTDICLIDQIGPPLSMLINRCKLDCLEGKRHTDVRLQDHRRDDDFVTEMFIPRWVDSGIAISICSVFQFDVPKDIHFPSTSSDPRQNRNKSPFLCYILASVLLKQPGTA